MACFSQIIGIKNGCVGYVPSSGLYLDDINITLGDIEKITTRDVAGAISLVNDKIAFAGNIIKNSVQTHFQNRFISTSIIENLSIGEIQENKPVISPVANTYKGLEIEYGFTDSFLNVEVSTISLFSDYTGDVNVFIYDEILGTLLDTIVVSAVAGENVTKVVNKTFAIGRRKIKLAFLVDATFDAYKVLAGSGPCSSCSTDTKKVYWGGISARSIKVDSSADIIPQNILGSSESHGLTVSLNVNCDHESWLCSMGNLFALPLLYQTGILLLDYSIDYTTRLNSKTIIDPDRLREQRNKLIELYNESMNGVVGRMMLPNDSRCFACNDRLKSVVILP